MSNIVKTLHSDFHKKPKVFHSIFECKRKNNDKLHPFLIAAQDEKRFSMGRFGPLVVVHTNSAIKNKVKRAQSEYKRKMRPNNQYKVRKSKNYNSPFYYFEEHKNCEEMKCCWHNLRGQEIRRHYTPKKYA